MPPWFNTLIKFSGKSYKIAIFTDKNQSNCFDWMIESNIFFPFSIFNASSAINFKLFNLLAVFYLTFICFYLYKKEKKRKKSQNYIKIHGLNFIFKYLMKLTDRWLMSHFTNLTKCLNENSESSDKIRYTEKFDKVIAFINIIIINYND